MDAVHWKVTGNSRETDNSKCSEYNDDCRSRGPIRPGVDNQLSDPAFPGGSVGFTELDVCHCFSLAFSLSTKNDPATFLKSVIPFPPQAGETIGGPLQDAD